MQSATIENEFRNLSFTPPPPECGGGEMKMNFKNNDFSYGNDITYGETYPDDAADFDLERALEEIQGIVTRLENDTVMKNANAAKYDAAYSIGMTINTIHENMKGREARAQANTRIKEVLGRERSMIQNYKKIIAFEKDMSLADLGIVAIAKLSGNIKNYTAIFGCKDKNISRILKTLNPHRCQDADSLREFENEIATQKPSQFCKDCILNAANAKFGEDYTSLLASQEGLTVSASKKLYNIIQDGAKYEFKQCLQNIEKKKHSGTVVSVKAFALQFRLLEKKLDTLFYNCENEEMLQYYETFQGNIHAFLERQAL